MLTNSKASTKQRNIQVHSHNTGYGHNSKTLFCRCILSFSLLCWLLQQDRFISTAALSTLDRVTSSLLASKYQGEPASVLTGESVTVGVKKAQDKELANSVQEVPINGSDGIVKAAKFQLPEDFSLEESDGVDVKVIMSFEYSHYIILERVRKLYSNEKKKS